MSFLLLHRKFSSIPDEGFLKDFACFIGNSDRFIDFFFYLHNLLPIFESAFKQSTFKIKTMEKIEVKTKMKRDGLIFGTIVLIAGILLFAINIGWIARAWTGILFTWQFLIILIGAISIYKGRTYLWPIYQILFGLFFLIPKIARTFPERWQGFPENFTADYWPVLIILAGVFILLHKFMHPVSIHHDWNKKVQAEYIKNTVLGSNFSKNAIFGGGEHIILDPVFKGGDINAIFGGITLDLRRTTIPEGETYLDLNAVFGGVTLYVPGDWYLETHIDTVFGGFEDKRFVKDPVDKSKRLIISGACVFGGGEIMS